MGAPRTRLQRGLEIPYRQDYLGQGTPAILIEQFHTAADTLDRGLTEKQPQAKTLLALGSDKGGAQLLGDMQRYTRATIADTQA